MVTARDEDMRPGCSGVHLWPIGMGTHGVSGKKEEQTDAEIIIAGSGGSMLPQ